MPVHDLSFERVVDLSSFATEGRPQRFDLFAGALSMPPGPVRVLGADDILRDGEFQYRASIPPVSLYSLPGHVLGGGGAALVPADDPDIFWRDDCNPIFLRSVFAPAGDGANQDPTLAPLLAWAGSLANPEAKIVEYDFPIATVLHRNMVYGHALFEMLPRAWLIAQLAILGRSIHVALDLDAPGWLCELISLLIPPERMIRFDARSEVLRVPAVVSPSMMHLDYYLHPAFNLFVDDLLNHVLGTGARPSPVRRLFLSRRGLGPSSVLDEAEAFEARLAAAGFEILRPETMSFHEQARAYAGARVIVSEYGSASHNALFAPFGGTHIVINQLNRFQERIAALRQQSLGIVEPAGGFVARVNNDLTSLRRARVDPDAVLKLVDVMEKSRKRFSLTAVR